MFFFASITRIISKTRVIDLWKHLHRTSILIKSRRLVKRYSSFRTRKIIHEHQSIWRTSVDQIRTTIFSHMSFLISPINISLCLLLSQMYFARDLIVSDNQRMFNKSTMWRKTSLSSRSLLQIDFLRKDKEEKFLDRWKYSLLIGCKEIWRRLELNYLEELLQLPEQSNSCYWYILLSIEMKDSFFDRKNLEDNNGLSIDLSNKSLKMELKGTSKRREYYCSSSSTFICIGTFFN